MNQQSTNKAPRSIDGPQIREVIANLPANIANIALFACSTGMRIGEIKVSTLKRGKLRIANVSNSEGDKRNG